MDYWTLKKKAIMGSMQSGRLAEAEGYPLKLENAIKGNMKDYRIWGNKKGKNYLDISKIVATPNSTANLFISEVNSDTGSVIIFSTDNYTGGGYCNTGKFLKNIAPHLEVGKTYFLNGTSQSSAKRMYLTTSKYIWNFGTSHTITEDDLNSAIVLYGLSVQNGQGTGICKIEGLSITEEASTEYEPYQENDGLGAFGNVDVVTSGKNMLKATDFYSVCGDNYSLLTEDGRNCVRFTDSISRKYQSLTFKENTQYTVSFDCKTTIRLDNNTSGSNLFQFFYDDGTTTVIHLNRNTDWIHKTLTSIAGKTISHIGLSFNNIVNWCYIDIDTFQFEEGEETPYEPYREPITTTIDLTGHNSIMPNEYIDFKNQAIVRSDGTEEEIILTKIPLHKGYNIITASDAELEATKMYGKYLKKG